VSISQTDFAATPSSACYMLEEANGGNVE